MGVIDQHLYSLNTIEIVCLDDCLVQVWLSLVFKSLAQVQKKFTIMSCFLEGKEENCWVHVWLELFLPDMKDSCNTRTASDKIERRKSRKTRKTYLISCTERRLTQMISACGIDYSALFS